MRVWLARVFIGLAFSLLLAHNLIIHHHDEEAAVYDTDHHHDHDENTTTPFDNVKLDGHFIQKLDLQQAIIGLPVNLVVVEYRLVQLPVVIVKQHSTPPPEHPPSLFNVDASELRGPPVYC